VLATVVAAITAMVQFGAMIFAAFYLEQATSQRQEELDAIEIDKEVAKLEAAEERVNKCYVIVTQWDVVPTWAKATLYVSFLIMVWCCYMVMLFSNRCFADYQLDYTIEENLDGNWKNLVLPLGWYSMLFFLISCTLLCIFLSWASVSTFFAE
jgi:TRAP-type C4-dicarboxylate transport system permease small subunit